MMIIEEFLFTTSLTREVIISIECVSYSKIIQKGLRVTITLCLFDC